MNKCYKCLKCSTQFNIKLHDMYSVTINGVFNIFNRVNFKCEKCNITYECLNDVIDCIEYCNYQCIIKQNDSTTNYRFVDSNYITILELSSNEYNDQQNIFEYVINTIEKLKSNIIFI